MDSGAIRLARDALATPDLRRLQLSAAAAGVGGWAFMVSLAVYAYAVGGAAAVGLAALVRMAPAGLAAPLTGLAADRFPRRDVLLAATLARTLLLAAAALVVALDGPFALLLVLATLFTVAATAHKPAQAALLPRLAPDRARQAASNALWTAIDSGAFVLGAIAGGAARGRLRRRRGVRGQRRRVRGRRRSRLRGSRATPRRVGAARARAGAATATVAHVAVSARDAAEGLRVVARDRRLRLLVGVLSVSTLVEGMVDVLVVVTALSLVDLGDAGAGWLNAAWGIGGIAGGVLALRLLARGRLAVSLPAGGMLIGVPLLLLANVPGALTALVALLVLGVGYALVESAGITLLQRLAHDRRARACVRRRGELLLADHGRGRDARSGADRARRPARRAGARRRRAAAADAQPLGRAHPTGAGRHCRTSGSGVSSGSTCARSFSKSGGSDRRSPSASSGSSDVKPGPIDASSNRIPPGSRK